MRSLGPAWQFADLLLDASRDDASLRASGLAFDGSPDAFECKKPRAMSPAER
jgi:hypothetical protein